MWGQKMARRKITSTTLSWEDKNPIDYIYRPSQAMIRIRKAQCSKQ